MYASSDITPRDSKLLEQYGFIVDDKEEQQVIVMDAKRHLFELGLSKSDQTEEASINLNDRTLVQQLPPLTDPQAARYLNEVMPGVITNLIEMIQGIDFTYIKEDGSSRVFAKNEASELFCLLAELRKTYREFTTPVSRAVPGFEQHFASRFSPFLSSLAELVKNASAESEKRKIQSYQADSSKMSLNEVHVLHQTYSARLSHHLNSSKAPGDVFKTLINWGVNPTINRYSTKTERDAVSFIINMSQQIYGQTT